MEVTEAQARDLLTSLADPGGGRPEWASSLFGQAAAVAAARALLGEQPAEPVLVAALAVYASGDPDPTPLRPWAADVRPGVRVLVADALLARGDPAGLPILIDLLAEAGQATDEGDAATPPWRWAARFLARWTADGTIGPPFDADRQQLAAAATRWRSWWTERADTLRLVDGRWRST